MTFRAYVFTALALSGWACGSSGSSSNPSLGSPAGSGGAPPSMAAAGNTSSVAGSAAAVAGEGGAGSDSAAGTGGEGDVAVGGAGLGGAIDAGAGGSGGAGGEGELRACPPVPACDTPLPELGEARAWRHWPPPIGGAQHRGRDLFLSEDEPQWVIANFRYGFTAVESPLDD